MDNYLNKSICTYLIKAQLCSDAGKNIYPSSTKAGKVAREYGYDHKDYFIQKAMDKINSTPMSGFSYYVEPGFGIGADTIIYFNFKFNGERHQISFHSYSSFKSYQSNSHKTRWDKKISGSRRSCDLLWDYLNHEVEGKANWKSLY